jgi:hypothetical protein
MEPHSAKMCQSPDEVACAGDVVHAGAGIAKSEEVDLIGLEPTTSSMPWKRSPN